MPDLKKVLRGEPAQWAVGYSIASALILAADTGDWREAAFAVAALAATALVGWRLSERERQQWEDGRK